MTAFLNSTSSPQARPLSVTLQGELRHARSRVRARVCACARACACVCALVCSPSHRTSCSCLENVLLLCPPLGCKMSIRCLFVDCHLRSEHVYSIY